MIGRLNPDAREVTVVGAGIAGLLLADRCDRLGYDVTLIEAAPHAGGMIQTRQTPHGIAEAAAHSLLVTPPLAALCERLGVELTPLRPDARARYVFRRGKPRRMPLRWMEGFEALARAAFAPARSTDARRLTVDEWGARHLGRGATDSLLAPMLAGIHGATPGELDLKAAFPSWKVPKGKSLLSWALNRPRERSTIDRPRLMAPLRGMGSLTAALEQDLRKRLGARFIRNQKVETLPDSANLALCVPPLEAARLLAAKASALAGALRAVPATPLITATVFLDREGVRKFPRGLGVLFPPIEKRPLLGVLFNSSAFEGRVTENQPISLTVISGGTSRPDQLSLDDSTLRYLIHQELDALFGLAQPPLHVELHRWPRALPRYSGELARAWSVAQDTWCARPGRVLFGNYTGQISIRGMVETTAKLDVTPRART